MSLPSMPAVGDLVGRYVLGPEIAQGGMAVVHVATMRGPGGFTKRFALKLMLPHLARDQHFVDMFLDEARTVAQIEHPNVVSVVDLGVHERIPYLAMEYLRGHDLATLHRAEPLPPATVLRVLADAARGLDATHAKGVIHRDATPHNLMVTYEGDVKLLDFGVARAADAIGKTATGEVKGKLAYLAPEQLKKGTKLSSRVDVWTIGVSAWQLLSGRPLFAADDEATTLWNILHEDIDDIRDHAEVSDAAAEIIMRCLERDPAERPESCNEIARSLDASACDRSALAAAVAARFAPTSTASPTRESDVMTAQVADPLTESQAARLPRWAMGIGVVCIVGVAAWLLGRGPDDAAAPLDRTMPVQTSAVPSSALSVASAPTSVSPKTLVLPIASEVRLVLVDGVKHDERPLRISLRETGEPPVVELFGPRGETRRYVLDGSETQLTLSAPSPSSSLTRPRPRPIRRTAPQPSPSSSPLMGSPFE